jgi:hypothetical protein
VAHGRCVGYPDASRIDVARGDALAVRSERRRPWVVDLEAVAALHFMAHWTADRTFISAGAGGRVRLGLDFSKKLLRSEGETCT